MGSQGELRGGFQVGLSLEGLHSVCNCLEVLGCTAHSERYLKWLELAGEECGDEWRGLERRGVGRDDLPLIICSQSGQLTENHL